MSAIILRGLTRRFGDLTAVDGVDLEIETGEVFGLLGPNGSGKTTMIRMLCGLLTPSAGTAVVAGVDVRQEPHAVRQHLGYMSQKFGLYEDLTVRENEAFYSGLYGLAGERQRLRIDEVEAFIGLAARSRQLVGTLSGGWKQRVALACALLHEPAVLFLDEPTAGVDPASRRLFWELIGQLQSTGTTVVVTTHYMDEAERCDRLALLHQGRLIAAGPPRDVARRFGPTASLEDAFVQLQEQTGELV